MEFSTSTPVLDSGTQPFSASFDTTGKMLDDNGSPVQQGWTRTSESATASSERTVTAVTVGDGYYRLRENIEERSWDSAVGWIDSTGIGITTFTQIDDDTINYVAQDDLNSSSYDWGTVSTQRNYAATLTR
jgi:hypothetical protein